jgi:hypothetical protein
LEVEQVAFLRELAEAARAVPREERTYMFIPVMGGALLRGPLDRELTAAQEHDIQDFMDAGLIRVRSRGRHNELQFTVAPEGHSLLAELASQQPLARVEDEIVSRYIDEEAFQQRYPGAYQRWTEAAKLLWSEGPETELTTIGHKTREAAQAFATTLVEREALDGADANPAHTVARLRAVIEVHRPQLGEARHELLDALVRYWGEVNDLLQRQEHGGQKENEPLFWEDGRRAVFQTAVLMYEVDRYAFRGSVG